MSTPTSGAATKLAPNRLKFRAGENHNTEYRRRGSSTSEGWNSVSDEILDQYAFTRMLSLERKRTERSGRRFILLLMDWVATPNGRMPANFAGFATGLSKSIRETDVVGWYEQESVFGIIFTEIGDGEINSIIGALESRVRRAFAAELTPDDATGARLSFHVYPEQGANGEGSYNVDLKLYPDQSPDADPKRVSRAIKRAVDIVGSFTGLLILSPFLILIAIAIKVSSKGPVLFRQKRVGRHGVMFEFLKFRSMYVANDESVHKAYVTKFISGAAEPAEANGKTVFKIKNDARVTRIGRLLRRTSLDELPQLLNVLRGEMSLVGPRPSVPYEVVCYRLWHKQRLLKVKPGITGMWQVGGRSRVKFDDMVRLDLQYAEHWSVWLDLMILLKTPAAVLTGEGAY